MNELTNLGTFAVPKITSADPDDIYRERLERLATLLENFEETENHNFDIMLWFGRFPQAECGTAGCAIGWAAQDEWFQAQGLSLSRPPRCEPRYRGLVSYDAVMAFFGISSTMASDLFHIGGYANSRRPVLPKHVAQRVRDVLEGKAYGSQKYKLIPFPFLTSRSALLDFSVVRPPPRPTRDGLLTPQEPQNES